MTLDCGLTPVRSTVELPPQAADGLHLDLGYSADLFASGSHRADACTLEDSGRGAVAVPETPIGRLPLLARRRCTRTAREPVPKQRRARYSTKASSRDSRPRPPPRPRNRGQRRRAPPQLFGLNARANGLARRLRSMQSIRSRRRARPWSAVPTTVGQPHHRPPRHPQGRRRLRAGRHRHAAGTDALHPRDAASRWWSHNAACWMRARGLSRRSCGWMRSRGRGGDVCDDDRLASLHLTRPTRLRDLHVRVHGRARRRRGRRIATWCGCSRRREPWFGFGAARRVDAVPLVSPSTSRSGRSGARC